ncbi:mPR-type GPCR [Apiospora arundinis]
MWGRVYAPILGNEMVSAGRLFSTAPESACTRSAFRSVLYLVNLIFWGSSHQIFHPRYLMRNVYTPMSALLQGFPTCHRLEAWVVRGLKVHIEGIRSVIAA